MAVYTIIASGSASNPTKQGFFYRVTFSVFNQTTGSYSTAGTQSSPLYLRAGETKAFPELGVRFDSQTEKRGSYKGITQLYDSSGRSVLDQVEVTLAVVGEV